REREFKVTRTTMLFIVEPTVLSFRVAQTRQVFIVTWTRDGLTQIARQTVARLTFKVTRTVVFFNVEATVLFIRVAQALLAFKVMETGAGQARGLRQTIASQAKEVPKTCFTSLMNEYRALKAQRFRAGQARQIDGWKRRKMAGKTVGAARCRIRGIQGGSKVKDAEQIEEK
ncbi:hypothetical protein C8J56DRAFT_971208, partial [Mycena floridula]